jgi:Protein of unknown function (DUF3768)
MTTKAKAIRAFNDELRQNFATGTAVMTAGVAALGAETVARIVKTIGVYDDFCHANDPYEEHDFGSFEVDGHKIFFKIDYYDKLRFCHVRPSRRVTVKVASFDGLVAGKRGPLNQQFSKDSDLSRGVVPRWSDNGRSQLR